MIVERPTIFFPFRLVLYLFSVPFSDAKVNITEIELGFQPLWKGFKLGYLNQGLGMTLGSDVAEERENEKLSETIR
jgi:hypothetical protein